MNQAFKSVMSFLCLCLVLLCSAVQQAQADLVTELVPPIEQGALKSTIKQLTLRGDQDSQAILQLWLSGKLFIDKASHRLVTAEKAGRNYNISHPLTGETFGEVGRRTVKKVRVNNLIRAEINTALSMWDLKSDEPAKRVNAVKSLFRNLDVETHDLLTSLLRNGEKDDDVLESIHTALALYDLNHGNSELKHRSLNILVESDDPYIHSQLMQARQDSEDKDWVKEIDQVLKTVEQRKQYYGMIENLFFGLSLGSVLLLAAIGLAITFGVMGVINMAHGEMMMLGAYTTFVIQSWFPSLIEQSLFIAVPTAFLVAGLVGVLVERLVIRHLYGRPLETLLATFGISLILQQAVRSIFSPLNQAVSSPSWMSGSLIINESLSLTWSRLYIIGFSLVVFLALLFVLRYTRFGLNVRAVTQNRSMASSMGIRTGQVDALTFGLGSGIAGVAGVALSQLTNVGPNLGQNYIIDSFMVVVFGGVGNLWGTLVAAMGLGVVNKFLEPWAGAVVAKILVLVFIILFIQKRPKGLFALKGRAVED